MSPMLRGGGVAFGPKPRDFATDLPKKVYDLAWRTALSYRFRKGELIIVDNAMEIESPSTRLLGDIFKHHEKLRGKGRSLMVTLEERPLLEEALAEMGRGEQTWMWDEVDVKDLLGLTRVIIERDALHNILLTHEEDLTHTTLQPWHKSLIRSSPPSALESTIGWQEFRALSLWKPEDKMDRDADVNTPKTKNAARAAAYSSAASTRYLYAESLPMGPKRTELTVSVYNLTADAKELQFLETTGLPFSKYRAERDAEEFPRLQALAYQQDIQTDLVTEAAETSRQKAEELQLKIYERNVTMNELQYDAAELAAQVHEHRRDAFRLNGEQDKAEEQEDLAGGERTNVDSAELGILQAKAELAKQMALVAGLNGDFKGQQKAVEEQGEWEEALRMKGEVDGEEADEEMEDVVGEVEEVDVATGVEPVKDAKDEKRI
jgi:large subunit ribosomal protein L4